jgi:glycerophosphoryl diester phosphodiesterase
VSAAQVGADAVELDVQLSRDGVAMVIHDDSLRRVTGQSGNVSDFDAEQLQPISCHESRRFGELHYSTYMAKLADVCSTLNQYSCKVFIEI